MLAVYALSLLAGLHDWRSSRTLWLRCVRRSPGLVTAHSLLANAYVQMGMLPQAEAHYRTRLMMAQDEPGPAVSLGTVLRKMGRYDEALAVLRQAAERFHDDFGTMTQLGNACLAFHQALAEEGQVEAADALLNEAARHFERAMTLAKTYTDRGLAHLNLGNVAFQRGEIAAAEAHFKQAVALRPEDPNALASLGQVYSTAERYDEALALYERAVRYVAQPQRILGRIASVNEQLGRWPAAESAWVRALDALDRYGDPGFDRPMLLKALARAREKQGRMAEAHAVWRQAAQLIPHDPEVQAGLQRTAEGQ